MMITMIRKKQRFSFQQYTIEISRRVSFLFFYMMMEKHKVIETKKRTKLVLEYDVQQVVIFERQLYRLTD
jgi:hypothetical protein